MTPPAMPTVPGKRVLLAQPRGYCAGVERAIDSVEKALAVHGTPVYVRKQIVHNKHVVADLEAKGALFAEATQRKLRTIDATCPLVTKVHHEARRFSDEGLEILLIGHAGHEEVVGTAGQAPDRVKLVDGPIDAAQVEVRDPSRVAWLSQTTLSVDETLETVHALRARFPQPMDPPSDDICYATQNRQAAVKQIAPASDLVIVVGSRNSSNSVRLVEVALESGARASHLVDDADEIDEAWLDGVTTVGLTSGASVPDSLVLGVLDWLSDRGFDVVEEIEAVRETLTFALPPELRRDIKARAER